MTRGHWSNACAIRGYEVLSHSCDWICSSERSVIRFTLKPCAGKLTHHGWRASRTFNEQGPEKGPWLHSPVAAARFGARLLTQRSLQRFDLGLRLEHDAHQRRVAQTQSQSGRQLSQRIIV